jgi:hypothetical protein
VRSVGGVNRLIFICLIAMAPVTAVGGSSAYAGDQPPAKAPAEGAPQLPDIPCEDWPCYPQPACNDAVDNDGDGAIDYGWDPGCWSKEDDDEYNAPPPPPPPPPPPACSDGWDNDGDGYADLRDYGCYDGNDTNEGDNELVNDPFEWGAVAYACSVTSAQNGQWVYQDTYSLNSYCPASTARCKRQEFKARWSQAGLYNVLNVNGFFVVCYRHNAGIVTVLARNWDQTYARYPWQWKGNADGYPRHYRYTKYVDFQYRGKFEFCPANFGCLSTKWPYVNIRFYDNNTMTYAQGIG